MRLDVFCNLRQWFLLNWENAADFTSQCRGVGTSLGRVNCKSRFAKFRRFKFPTRIHGEQANLFRLTGKSSTRCRFQLKRL